MAEATVSVDAFKNSMRADAPGEVLSAIPHARILGIRLVAVGPGQAELFVPYDLRLVGDPETGVVHGGVVTTVMDTCAGAAVMNLGSAPRSTATLDFRIDYMRPARPGHGIRARARVFRETRSIAFVRVDAFHDDPEEPIATAVGAFMVERAV